MLHLALRIILGGFSPWWLLIALAPAILASAGDCWTTILFLRIPGDFELTRIWVLAQKKWPRFWPAIFMAACVIIALALFVLWPPLDFGMTAVELYWVINNIRLIRRTAPK